MVNRVQRSGAPARKWSILSLIGIICLIVVAGMIAFSTVTNAVSPGQRDIPSSPIPSSPRGAARWPFENDASVELPRRSRIRHVLPDAGLPPPGFDAGRLEPLDSDEHVQRPSR